MRPVPLLTCLALAACGRYNLPAFAPQDGAPPEAGAIIGPVDLTKSPATLGLTCDGVTTSLAFKMPCLVGMNLAGPGRPEPGAHEVECHMAQPGDPYVWSFLLPLGGLAEHPNLVVLFPSVAPASLPTGAIDLGAEKARISDVHGQLSFSRVDPVARAFEGTFTGTMVLKGETSGTQVTCHIDGPFWGAPGGFI